MRISAIKISAEIEKLKKMKPNVRPFSFFGDDHHEAIDKQIYVLEEGLSEDDINALADESEEEGDGDWCDHYRDNAIRAALWAAGEEGTPPSEEWAELVVKKK